MFSNDLGDLVESSLYKLKVILKSNYAHYGGFMQQSPANLKLKVIQREITE
ncbi:hypothetical protein VXN72_11315 [Acinetobacter soli]|uniref:hypothetical protein n=1 Tax=uncultured Acinetobacter sp. TaxID=165433 RepID=UPI002590CB51|nr:hypothetical protein [uncultured Acinetobacter sp.]